MAIKLKDGYYFVKYRDKWEVAQLYHGGWMCSGSEMSYVQEEFDEIGMRIGHSEELRIMNENMVYLLLDLKNGN